MSQQNYWLAFEGLFSWLRLPYKTVKSATCRTLGAGSPETLTPRLLERLDRHCSEILRPPLPLQKFTPDICPLPCWFIGLNLAKAFETTIQITLPYKLWLLFADLEAGLNLVHLVLSLAGFDVFRSILIHIDPCVEKGCRYVCFCIDCPLGDWGKQPFMFK